DTWGKTDLLGGARVTSTSLTLRLAQADAPRPAIGIVADQSDLAEIGVDVFESLLAQHVGDAVRDKPLADQFQRHPHPRTPKGDAARPDVDKTIIDQPFCHAPCGS